MANEKKLSTGTTDPKEEIGPPISNPRIDGFADADKAEEPILPKKLGSVEEKQKVKENLGFKLKPDEQSQEEAEEAEDQPGSDENLPNQPSDSYKEAGNETGGNPDNRSADSSNQPNNARGGEKPKSSPKQTEPVGQPGEQQSPQNGGQTQSDEDDKNKKKKDEEEEKKKQEEEEKKKKEEEEKKKKDEEEEKKKKEDEEKKAGNKDEEKAPEEGEPEGTADKEPADKGSEEGGAGNEAGEPKGAEAGAEGTEGAESGLADNGAEEAVKSQRQSDREARAIQAASEAAEKEAATAAEAAKLRTKIQVLRKAIIKFLSSWQAIAIVFGLFLLMGLITWIIGIFMPRTHTDTENPADKAAIEEVVSLSSANKITFTQPDDLDKIKKGEIGKPSLQMMSYLANRHETIEINYNNQNYNGSTELTTGGSNSSSSSTTLPAGENEPYEFDIVSVDSIKCINTATNAKLPTIPINLSSNFNWSGQIPTGNNNSVKCAVSYYPGETTVNGAYSSQFGPQEFSILDLATAGPQASRQKMAEVTSEMLKVDGTANSGTDAESYLPLKITLDSGYALNTGSSTGVVGVLKNEISTAYPNTTSKDEGVVVGDLTYGIHINYL